MSFFGNITFRKNRPHSESEVTAEEINASETTVNASTSSMPEISDDEEESRKQLESEIKLLKQQLQTAHEEIINLNLENSQLKTDILELQKKQEICHKVTKSLKYDCVTPKRKKDKSTTLSKTLATTKPTTSAKNGDVSNPGKLISVSTQTTPKFNSSNKAKKSPKARGKLSNNVSKSTKPKSKICIISSNNTNKILRTAEDTLPNSSILHYSSPGAGISYLLEKTQKNVKDFTMDDYCIIMIGEEDFLTTNNYIDLVYLIREELQKIKHTNVILCVPTFKCNEHSDLFNWRIETFNSALYMDLQEHKHAHALDTNLNLTYDNNMFHRYSGQINNYGTKVVFDDLAKLINSIKKKGSVQINKQKNTNDGTIDTPTQLFRN